jgi:hypothetical protein
MKQYKATDGSLWHVSFDGYFWTWSHEDFDGAPDSGDHRCGFSCHNHEVPNDIEEWVEDHNWVEPINPEGDRGPNYLPDPTLDA